MPHAAMAWSNATAICGLVEKQHGYGPRKAHDDNDYTYRHLKGYNRDPARSVPALQYLLPRHHATVSDDGMVAIAGRHYYDALLSFWHGRPIDVRVSRHDRSSVYVYLDGAILCQAQEAGEATGNDFPHL